MLASNRAAASQDAAREDDHEAIILRFPARQAEPSPTPAAPAIPRRLGPSHRAAVIGLIVALAVAIAAGIGLWPGSPAPTTPATATPPATELDARPPRYVLPPASPQPPSKKNRGEQPAPAQPKPPSADRADAQPATTGGTRPAATGTPTRAPTPPRPAPTRKTSPPKVVPAPTPPVPSPAQRLGKARITDIRAADGLDGIGRDVRVVVTVDQSPASERTLFLIAHLPQQGGTIPHAIHVAKAIVPRAVGPHAITVVLGGGRAEDVVGLVRTFKVVSADPQATELLRRNLDRQFDSGYEGRRLGLPKGAEVLDTSGVVERTRV